MRRGDGEWHARDARQGVELLAGAERSKSSYRSKIELVVLLMHQAGGYSKFDNTVLLPFCDKCVIELKSFVY
jgi:hypothetical protein